MNFKKLTSSAKISLILMIVLSLIYSYVSTGQNWNFYGIPGIILNIINVLGLISILLYFIGLSIKNHTTFNFEKYIKVGLIGAILYTLITLTDFIPSALNGGSISFGIPALLPSLLTVITGLLFIFSIKEIQSFYISNYTNKNKLKSSFKYGLIGSAIGILFSLTYVISNFLMWQEAKEFYSENLQYHLLLGLPRFSFQILFQLIPFILLLVFFVRASRNREAIKEFFISKTFNTKSKSETESKPKNMKKTIFTIIGAILGLPLSYYFQPEMVRQKMSLLDYTTKINEIFEQKDLIGNVILGIVIFAVIGFIVGYFMDKNESKTTD